jgi:D-galactose 1-dehydrogenase
MTPIKIAIVGLGKIARDQHVPSLAASNAFELIAVASPHGRLEGVPSFESIETLLQKVPDVAAVALCMTPRVRYEVARYALERGRHVLLEKTVTPLQLAADAFLSGHRVEVEAFVE